jgi:ribosomal protein L37AE/L43A
MRRPSVGSATTASKADYLVCPGCGCGQLQPPRGPLSRLLKCDHCEYAFDNTIVETLKQIVTLPEALGKHSCECGHPEMRRLPDGVFHCPACRAEVLPISIPEPGQIAARRSLAAFQPIPLSAQAHQTI